MAGRLFGLGVGPGDPELITVKALRLLREADVIAYPTGKAVGGNSIGIVEGYLRPEQIRLPMLYPATAGPVADSTDYLDIMKGYYDATSVELAAHLDAGRDVADHLPGRSVLLRLLHVLARPPRRPLRDHRRARHLVGDGGAGGAGHAAVPPQRRRHGDPGDRQRGRNRAAAAAARPGGDHEARPHAAKGEAGARAYRTCSPVPMSSNARRWPASGCCPSPRRRTNARATSRSSSSPARRRGDADVGNLGFNGR